MRRQVLVTIAVAAIVGMSASTWAQGLSVEAPEASAGRLKVTVTSPGVFKAVVLQASGGGIGEFYNLASDPDAKQSLPWSDRGLFEVGWHGGGFKNPNADKKTCCNAHALGGKPEDNCYDGCADWPSMGHQSLKATGELAVIEQSPARVRVRTKAPFVWWSKFVHKLTAEAVYTFYPSGRIVIQVRVQNAADNRPFHWSGEYGPHLTVGGSDKDEKADRGFAWSTPKQDAFKSGSPSEELVLAASDKTKTRLMLSIPPEEAKLFNHFMQHNGRSIGWDRAGYGSGGIVMEPGYDNTWACMIEMGADAPNVAAFKTATEALPFAADYREPARITVGQAFLPANPNGGQTGMSGLLTDDAGDFNKDGFNESEGCYVLKGPGPLAFTFEKGKGAGFAPAFKITGWAGDAPRSVKVDGKDVPVAAGVVDGKLIVQILGAVAADKAQVEIGK